MTTTTDTTPAAVTARLRTLRSGLAGQMRAERLKEAQLRFGTLYSLAEIRRRVGDTLPWRAGYVRSALVEPIETHAQPIPDDALLKYGDALDSGLFSRFLVATPRYYEAPQTDPWLVAEVTGTDRFAVIASWA